MPAAARPGAGDRQRDAGAAPVELLGVDHLHLAVGVGGRALDGLEALKPCLRASLMTSQGVLSSSSCLRAAGRITSRAKVRQRVLELLLLLVQCEIHASSFVDACRATLIDWSVSQSREV